MSIRSLTLWPGRWELRLARPAALPTSGAKGGLIPQTIGTRGRGVGGVVPTANPVLWTEGPPSLEGVL